MKQSGNLGKGTLGWACQKYLVGLLILEMLLISCTTPVPAVSPSDSLSHPATQMPENAGQQLPIGAQVKIGDQLIQLEVAQTPEQQEIGLMYRKELADDRGMLFEFSFPRQVGFWMKNCLINLDMVFLRDGTVQAISSDVPPCTEEPCPVYGPKVPVDQVIELRGRRAKELGLKVGDRLNIQYP